MLVSEIGEEIGRELVPATPVLTGYARANWRPSLNEPASVPVSFLDPSGEATISRIALVARRYSLGDTFFLVSWCPYIEALNDGSSPKAPAGFVQMSIEKGVKVGINRYSLLRRTGLGND